MSHLPFLSRGKLYVVETDDPKTKRLIARYWGVAVNRLIGEGDTSELDKYRGQTHLGDPFETDPDVVEDFWLSTDFDFQDFYEP
jgi:hypothetical protein